MNPNAPEESLDLRWIERVSRYSAPVTLSSKWLVKVETHYLGGMRHFAGGRSPIADPEHEAISMGFATEFRVRRKRA